MTDNDPTGARHSFQGATRSLIAATLAAYKLAPAAVVVLASIVVAVVGIAIHSATLMLATVLLIVLAVSVVVYIGTSNYGEASLALVAGLLTAYSVSWTRTTFVSFVAVWSAFSFIALIVASIRIAAKTEGIFRQAAISLSADPADVATVEKLLRSIGSSHNSGDLGPVERAGALRIFAYRRLELTTMVEALKSTGMLSVITALDSQTVAKFIADMFRLFEVDSDEAAQLIGGLIYLTVQRTAVPPADFMLAVERSRSLVLTRTMTAADYFEELHSALDRGVPPDSVGEYLEERSRSRTT
jgi:hypothetical protein